jgi:hypothetical protein
MDRIADPDLSHPEKIPIILPSGCGTASARIRACLEGLPDMEAKLRMKESEDALEGVRDGLRVRTKAAAFKMRNITGQVQSGRAGGVLRQIDIRIHSRKIRYRCARAAVLQLLGPGAWEDLLKELKDEDVRGINERALNKVEQKEREARMERLRGKNEEDEEYLVEEGIVARVQGESKRVLSWIWYNTQVSENDPEFLDGAYFLL